MKKSKNKKLKNNTRPPLGWKAKIKYEKAE